jgi:hypothetical protein
MITECNCSICQKKGILHTATEQNELTLVKGKDALTLYQFGSGVAEHQFCKICGIHVFGRPRSAPDRLTVNVRCLDDFEEILSSAKISRFDGQNHPKDQSP